MQPTSLPRRGRLRNVERDVMDKDKRIIEPPIYLIGKMYSCWRCEARMPVVSVLAPVVRETEGEICILSEIIDLPEPVVAYIQRRVPTFKLKFSNTIGFKYFANTCPKCGVLSGNFHLHCEPGAPFFPTDEREAEFLYMTKSYSVLKASGHLIITESMFDPHYIRKKKTDRYSHLLNLLK